MRRLLILVCMAAMLSLGATANIRCPGVGPNTITIEYINSATADILVDLLVSDDPLITQDELLAGGVLFQDLVGFDEIVSFDLFCDEAAALIIDIASLEIPGGPAVGTNILYLDEDYFCGEVISFEFTTNLDESELFVDVAFFDQ